MLAQKIQTLYYQTPLLSLIFFYQFLVLSAQVQAEPSKPKTTHHILYFEYFESSPQVPCFLHPPEPIQPLPMQPGALLFPPADG